MDTRCEKDDIIRGPTPHSWSLGLVAVRRGLSVTPVEVWGVNSSCSSRETLCFCLFSATWWRTRSTTSREGRWMSWSSWRDCKMQFHNETDISTKVRFHFYLLVFVCPGVSTRIVSANFQSSSFRRMKRWLDCESLQTFLFTPFTQNSKYTWNTLQTWFLSFQILLLKLLTVLSFSNLMLLK